MRIGRAAAAHLTSQAAPPPLRAPLSRQEASLTQLRDEQTRLHESLAAMQERWDAEKAAHGAAVASDALAELAAARAEEDRLRAGLQRCYADYAAAVDALSASEQAREQLQQQQHSGGGWRAAPRQHAPHGADHASGGAYKLHAQQAQRAHDRWHYAAQPHLDDDRHAQQQPGHEAEPLWHDDQEAVNYAHLMMDHS